MVNRQQKEKIIKWVVLLIVLSIGVALRLYNCTTMSFHIDEAESSINALSILEHGFPVDNYLGLPIYENTLIEVWQNNKEYEFRDSSYSNKGLAVYHGWLPLYSIAGTFALFGISPDPIIEPMAVQHTSEEILQRTVVPRLPAIGFSLGFMLLMFIAARRMGGKVEGWITLVLMAFADDSVKLGSEARYHAAMVMFTMASGLFLWQTLKRGRWRDFILWAISIVLLFHTHVLSCFIICCLSLAFIPFFIKRTDVLKKYFIAATIIILGTVPWVVFTGFIDQASVLPKTSPMMIFNHLMNHYIVYLPLVLPPIAATGLLLLALTDRNKLPKVFTQSVMERRFAIIFLTIWVVIGFICFNFLIPTASHFPTRLALTIAIPSTLLAGITLACIVQIPSRNYVKSIFYITLGVSLIAGGYIFRPIQMERMEKKRAKLTALVDYLSQQDYRKDTRIYASPGHHLRYKYFSGLPIQSIAPIRKSFLDSYQGDIFILELLEFLWPATDDINAAAKKMGKMLLPDETERLAYNLAAHLFCDDDPRRATLLHPSPGPVPLYLEPVLAEMRAERKKYRNLQTKRRERYLIGSGFTLSTYAEWWQMFFYRFVNPKQRSGEFVNYDDRIRNAQAILISNGECVVYHSLGNDVKEIKNSSQ